MEYDFSGFGMQKLGVLDANLLLRMLFTGGGRSNQECPPTSGVPTHSTSSAPFSPLFRDSDFL